MRLTVQYGAQFEKTSGGGQVDRSGLLEGGRRTAPRPVTLALFGPLLERLNCPLVVGEPQLGSLGFDGLPM